MKYVKAKRGQLISKVILEKKQTELEVRYVIIRIRASLNSEERLSKLEDRAEEDTLESANISNN